MTKEIRDMRMWMNGAVLSMAFAAPLWGFTLPEGDPETQGLAIARESTERDDGFENFVANMTMILRDRHGNESRRELRVRTLEVEGDGDKSLVVFDSPRDVKGTAFLSFSHRSGADDQWLYLPALKRVKRIASNNRSGPFMGSEFAYEDITSQEVEKFTYRYLRTEMFEGTECFVLERHPVGDRSGYARQQTWLDTDELRMQQIVFYDRGDKLLKTLTYDGYERYGDRHWRASTMTVENHQTGKSTTLEWSDYAFEVDLDEGDFHKNSLKRIR